MKLLHPLLFCAGAACLSACDDGRITLSVTDAPIDFADEVVVQFAGVAFERDDGSRDVVEFDSPLRIDLSRLTGEVSRVLVDSQPLPAASYRAIEFSVDGNSQTTDTSYVLLSDGRRLPLYVPDAFEDDLRVVADFIIEEEETVSATVDFDLRRSIVIVDDVRAELRPSLRFILDDEASSVTGTVSESLLRSPCVPAIYLYEGSDVQPDDVGGSGEEPVSSAIVTTEAGSGTRRYTIGFLEPGDYTLALTCEADLDEPDSNDDIDFVRTRDIELRAGRRETANIQ